jgi:hypothetical protein
MAGEVVMKRDANVSNCQRYRYWLLREWNPLLPVLYFVMLNPSTADADRDDQTIRKCIRFAELNGYGAIMVYNLFAFRATKPQVLHAAADTIDVAGPLNDYYLQRIPHNSDVCLAWGSHARRYPQRRQRVFELLSHTNKYSLRMLADGTPAHPLMLPYTCKLQWIGVLL